jgi:hypothetical protein
MRATPKSTLTPFDQERNRLLITFIKEYLPKWRFSSDAEAVQFFNLLPTIVGDQQKRGVSLADYMGAPYEQQLILDYLAGDISQGKLEKGLNASRSGTRDEFNRNDKKAASQYSGPNSHDRPSILALLGQGKSVEDIVKMNYGWLQGGTDVSYALSPLHRIPGVYVLDPQASLDLEKTIKPHLMDNKIVIVPVNYKTGNHWQLNAFYNDPSTGKLVESAYVTLKNGFCGDSAILGGYEMVSDLNEDLHLGLHIPERVHHIHQNLKAHTDETNDLRRRTIETIQYVSKTETEQPKEYQSNDPNYIHKNDWLRAITTHRNSQPGVLQQQSQNFIMSGASVVSGRQMTTPSSDPSFEKTQDEEAVTEQSRHFFQDPEVLANVKQYEENVKRDKKLISKPDQQQGSMMTDFACSFYQAAEVIKKHSDDIGGIKAELQNLTEAGESLDVDDDVLKIAQLIESNDDTATTKFKP